MKSICIINKFDSDTNDVNISICEHTIPYIVNAIMFNMDSLQSDFEFDDEEEKAESARRWKQLLYALSDFARVDERAKNVLPTYIKRYRDTVHVRGRF